MTSCARLGRVFAMVHGDAFLALPVGAIQRCVSRDDPLLRQRHRTKNLHPRTLSAVRGWRISGPTRRSCIGH